MTTSVGNLVRGHSLLRNRGFVLLWAAQVISAFGDPFGTIGLSWLLYSLTGSKLAVGGLWVALFVPQTLARVLAGPLVDRVDRRSLMVTVDLVRAFGYLAPVALLASGHLRVWHLYAVVVIEGALGPVFQLANMATLPTLIPTIHLVRANALSQGTIQLALMVGPAAAGIIVAVLGAFAALAVDALTFLASGTALLFLRGPASVQRSGPWLADFREGIRFFGQHRILLWLAVLVAISNFSWQAAYVMLLPYVKDILRSSAATFGLVTSAASAGYAIGAWTLGLKGVLRRPRMVVIGSLGAIGLATFLIPWARMPVTLVALMFAAGLFVPYFNIPVAAWYQQVVPDYLRGRVFAIRMLLAHAANPLGVAAGSATGEFFGLTPVFIGAGLIPVVSSAIAYILPPFRELDALGRS